MFRKYIMCPTLGPYPNYIMSLSEKGFLSDNRCLSDVRFLSDIRFFSESLAFYIFVCNPIPEMIRMAFLNGYIKQRWIIRLTP